MNLKEMLARLNGLANEMRELNEKGETRSDDDESRLDAVIKEFNDLGPKAQELKAKEEQRKAALAAAKAYEEPDGKRVSGIPAKVGAEQREQRDTRTIGQRFAESEQLKQYNEQGGKRSQPMGVRSFYHGDDADVQHREGMGPDELRALVQTGALPASLIQPQYVPGFFRGDDLQGTVRDVLINGQTASDAITFFRETAFTNAAAAVAQATATTGTTGLKPESAITFEEATASVKTLAHWIPITRQTLQDAAQLRTYVEQRLLDGLRLTESDQLLNGDGTGANLTGLRLTTGVQYLDNTATTGYWATNPVDGAGTARENFNRILRAKTVVRTTGRARANFAVVNPADMETFLVTVDGNANYYGAGPFGNGGAIPNLWGLRVVEDENQPAGEAVVGDGRMAAVWDRMQAQILVDTINDQFVRNMLTILAEERLTLTVFRPQAFARVELA